MKKTLPLFIILLSLLASLLLTSCGIPNSAFTEKEDSPKEQKREQEKEPEPKQENEDPAADEPEAAFDVVDAFSYTGAPKLEDWMKEMLESDSYGGYVYDVKIHIPMITRDTPNAEKFNKKLYDAGYSAYEFFQTADNLNWFGSLSYTYCLIDGIAAIAVNDYRGVIISDIIDNKTHVFYYDTKNDAEIETWQEYVSLLGYSEQSINDMLFGSEELKALDEYEEFAYDKDSIKVTDCYISDSEIEIYYIIHIVYDDLFSDYDVQWSVTLPR